jgi:hypothetical protein
VLFATRGLSYRRRLGTVQTELLDAIPHLIPVDPEEPAGVRLVARSPVKCLYDELTLDVLEAHAFRRQLELCRG